MNKAYKIFKISLYNIFSLNKFKQSKPIKKIGIIILIAYVLASVMFSFGFTSYSMAENLSKVKMMPFFLILFFNFVNTIILFTTMRYAKNTLYESKDNSLLLSLPINTKDIVVAKILSMYLVSFTISSLVLIPTFIIYATKVNISVGFGILYFISLFIMPIISTVLGSFIGYLMAKLMPKSNKKNYMEIILTFAFILVIMYANYNMNGLIKGITNNGVVIEQIMKYISYPTYLLRESLFNTNYLTFILYLFMNLIIAVFFVNIINNNYKKIISKLNENNTKKHKKAVVISSSSITKALLKKEKNTFLSSPIYIINTTFGILIIIIGAIASLLYDKSKIIALLEITKDINVSYLLIILILFVIGMTNITAASISMEKNRFWVLKSLPIKPIKIIYAKVLFSVLVVLPITIVSLIIFKFSLNILPIDIILLLILTVIYSFVVAMFGILVNLKYPKLNALNDQVIVKQSVSSTITILLPMMLYGIIVGIFADKIIFLDFKLVCSILILIFIILGIILKYLLNTWGAKRFQKIY